MFFRFPQCKLEKGLKIMKNGMYLFSMYDYDETYVKIDMHMSHIPHNLTELYFEILL